MDGGVSDNLGFRSISTEPGTCGDVRFCLVEVKFDALEDEAERLHLKRLPTSFRLEPGDVDRLREAAHHMLQNSEEFKRFLQDIEE